MSYTYVSVSIEVSFIEKIKIIKYLSSFNIQLSTIIISEMCVVESMITYLKDVSHFFSLTIHQRYDDHGNQYRLWSIYLYSLLLRFSLYIFVLTSIEKSRVELSRHWVCASSFTLEREAVNVIFGVKWSLKWARKQNIRLKKRIFFRNNTKAWAQKCSV